mmetsp:Transcript_21443/g.39964  ORF Transcript_21443/g.39964 Transcript_21443/m.39964 type:complete len:186 (-) Transcript_21443:1229-1786(-)
MHWSPTAFGSATAPGSSFVSVTGSPSAMGSQLCKVPARPLLLVMDVSRVESFPVVCVDGGGVDATERETVMLLASVLLAPRSVGETGGLEMSFLFSVGMLRMLELLSSPSGVVTSCGFLSSGSVPRALELVLVPLALAPTCTRELRLDGDGLVSRRAVDEFGANGAGTAFLLVAAVPAEVSTFSS